MFHNSSSIVENTFLIFLLQMLLNSFWCRLRPLMDKFRNEGRNSDGDFYTIYSFSDMIHLKIQYFKVATSFWSYLL